MLSRRELIGKAALGAAAAVAVSAARTGVASARAVPAATNDPAHGGEGRNAVLPPVDPPPAASVASPPPPRVPDRCLAELLPQAERLRRFAAAAPPAGGKLR